MILRRFQSIIEPIFFTYFAIVFALIWLVHADSRNEIRKFKTGRSTLTLLRVLSKREAGAIWPVVITPPLILFFSAAAIGQSLAIGALGAAAGIGLLFAIPLLFPMPSSLGEN